MLQFFRVKILTCHKLLGVPFGIQSEVAALGFEAAEEMEEAPAEAGMLISEGKLQDGAPPVISWLVLVTPINYSYIYHKPK